MHTYFRCYFCTLFLFVFLAPSAYCVRFQGLELDLISRLAPDTNSSTTAPDVDEAKSVQYLDELFRDYSFYDTATKSIDIILGTDNLTEASLSDTDNEKIPKQIRRIQEKSISREAQKVGTYNASRTPPRRKKRDIGGQSVERLPYNAKNNYLQEKEVKVSNEESMTRKLLCTKLAKDALDISIMHHSARTRDATTCLCVVLVDKHRRAKKFVFHNKDGSLQRTMREKAEELGYDIINAEQAHAAGEFMQFLLGRKQESPGRYTHILGMGCSRPHCAECDSLLKLFLGQEYNKFTAAMCVASAVVPSLPTVEKQEESVLVTFPALTYTAAGKSDAIEKKRHDNYYLSDYLKEALQVSCKLRDLKFGSRFTKKNESVEKQVEER